MVETFIIVMATLLITPSLTTHLLAILGLLRLVYQFQP